MPNPNPIKIQEKLMAVRLNCSYSFGRITDRQITAETNVSKQTRALLVRKELLPQDAGKNLRNLQGVLNSFYIYHKKVTMSSANEGERLLPVVFYFDYMSEYGRYQTLVREAYDVFELDYPGAILTAQQALGAAFNAADYPPQSDLRRYLNFRVTTLPLPEAGTLLTAVGASIEADVEGYLNEAVGQALKDVNERMRTALQRMVKQLSDPKGKVYDSLTESLAELCSFIPSFNVVADDSLNLLAEEVKVKLLGVGSDALRHDEVKRRETADAAAEILRRMG